MLTLPFSFIYVLVYLVYLLTYLLTYLRTYYILQSIEIISVREINCTIYSIAISCKEIMDDIATRKQENTNRKQEKPK